MKLLKNLNIKLKNWVVTVLLRNIIIPFVLMLIYFLILGPTSLFAKIFYRHQLHRRSNTPDSNWGRVDYGFENIDELKRQS